MMQHHSVDSEGNPRLVLIVEQHSIRKVLEPRMC
jgi:hypothetical protein